MAQRKKTLTTPGLSGTAGTQRRSSILPFLGDTSQPRTSGKGSKMAPGDSDQEASPPRLDSATKGSNMDHELRALLQSLPTKTDLAAPFTQMERNFNTKFDELGSDLKQLGGHVVDLEEDRDALFSHVECLNGQMLTQGKQLATLHRHLDDVDNKGRRNNLRIKGYLEADSGKEDVKELLRGLFNDILGRSREEILVLDRAHRALRPRGSQNDAPRDIICRLQDFTLKEEILRAAHKTSEIKVDGQVILFFQDVSWTTLQARRALKPLTEALQERDIRYRWGFPLSLQVTHNNQVHSVACPEDIPDFVRVFGLPEVDIPDWYGSPSPSDTLPFPQRPRWTQQAKKKRKGKPSAATPSEPDPEP
uniref:Uncharacterized protein n=1 Tax=Leptobrachium leishanense TaxID=445787 RepID=A0A8C5MWX4_9ANUR